MKEYKIGIVVGSLRAESLNKKLANALVNLASKELSFYFINISDVPLYNQDDDANPANSVTHLKNEIEKADALLFITPEYNRSIPGVLKNALDHASRPYGKNSWKGKPAGVIGVSVGALGTALAQQHLRNILSHLEVAVMMQPEGYITAKEDLFNADGTVGAGSRNFLQKWIDAYSAWIKKQLHT